MTIHENKTSSRRCRRLWTRDAGARQQATGAVVDGVFFHNGEDGLPVPDYVDENVSAKVVKIIQSYTGVVNKMVWRKE